MSLLTRVRWVFLLVCLIATASTVPYVFEPKTIWPVQAVALGCFPWLVWHWIHGYQRGGFSRAWLPIEGLAVLAVCLSIDTPLHALGLIYNGLVFRSLYGDRTEIAGTFMAYAGTFLAAVALTPLLGGPRIPLEESLPHVLGLTLLCGTFYFVGSVLKRHEQTLAREETLRRAGAALVATQDRDGVYAAALEAALDLTRSVPNVRVILTRGSIERMTVVTAAGYHASEIEGNPLNLGALPEHASARFLQKQPVEVERKEAADLRKSLGLTSETRPFFLIPLFIEEEPRGAIGVTSDAPLAAEVKEGLVALGFQVSLALEGVAYAEDRNWRQSEIRFRSLIQNSSDIVMVLGADGIMNYVSPSVQRILGYAPEDLIGEYNFALLHPDDLERVRYFHDENITKPGARPKLEARLRHADGSWRHFEGAGSNLLDDPSVNGIVINSRDVTERKAFEEQLSHQAFHDPLTDLPNRALFTDRLGHALARADRHPESVAILFLDLDNFKVINDSLGHKAGDELLVATAERLRQCLRPGDTVARLIGDEFTFLLEDMTDRKEAILLAERIAERMSKPFVLKGRDAFTTTSIGIAFATSGADRPDDLLRKADIAMYRAKRVGKAGYMVFDPGMDAEVHTRLRMEGELRRAVEREEFVLHYQVKVELDTNLQRHIRSAGSPAIVAAKKGKPSVLDAEALVRWQHPDRGLLEPLEFIPLAKETGLIIPMGRWILEKACRQAREWQQQSTDGPLPTVCVNLSGRQFQDPRLADEVGEVLRVVQLDPGNLVLEITETVLMENIQAAVITLQQLKDLGVKLAVDDFGMGYSSLSYLKSFPVDFLKIDRSFVEKLGEDPANKTIVAATIDLAHALGMRVVAEGVETVEQLEQLMAMRCDIAQGYYFSKPLPGEMIPSLLSPAIADKAPQRQPR